MNYKYLKMNRLYDLKKRHYCDSITKSYFIKGNRSNRAAYCSMWKRPFGTDYLEFTAVAKMDSTIKCVIKLPTLDKVNFEIEENEFQRFINRRSNRNDLTITYKEFKEFIELRSCIEFGILGMY